MTSELFEVMQKREKYENVLITDELGLGILLELGKKRRMLYPEFRTALSADDKDIIEKLRVLELAEFIRQNPCKEDKPQEQKKYAITLRGIFFLNKLRLEFPEYSSSFKFFF